VSESEDGQETTAGKPEDLPAMADDPPWTPAASAELAADHPSDVAGVGSANAVRGATDALSELEEFASDATLTKGGLDGSVPVEASVDGATPKKAAKKAGAPRKTATPRKSAIPRKSAGKRAVPVARPAAEGATESAVEQSPHAGAPGAAAEQSDPEAEPTVSSVPQIDAGEPEAQGLDDDRATRLPARGVDPDGSHAA
jgi:hypothetical protein